MDAALLSPPTSASTIGSRRNKFFKPLSSHGMPKAPPLSPTGSVRSHRFETPTSPRSTRSTSITSPPMTPGFFRSPMSPPLSAKSFGTLIDSEPSTPAYSPRPSSSQWDGSTLLLLSPVASSPGSPPEPVWEMVTPKGASKRKVSDAPSFGLRITSDTSLTSHPPTSPLPDGLNEKENVPPTKETADVEGEGKEEEQNEHGDTLGKFTTKVKSLLRRRTVNEKRAEKRRRARQDLEYMEDVHWTEM
ncbi:hypothetical protein EJ04DRAFT_305278 [Polyplosphaeria fusca]|uniref:Uncharacterized protein n=1 Tax=Polyplosphaeria fusca TaxID=682080 RepID=A0A9P4QXB6_9PLEO|nr:hypothetical protein EJ04DRAFT_305278 [Polyplosphaeria fusca]